MRTPKIITALAASFAVMAGSVAVPSTATAEVVLGGTSSATTANVTQDDGNGGAFSGFGLTSAKYNTLRYSNPLSAPGLLQLGLQTSVWVEGHPWENFKENTTVIRKDANTVVMTTDHGDGRTIVRTYEFHGSTATITVDVKAAGKTVIVDVTNSFAKNAPVYTVNKTGGKYHMVPENSGYEVDLEFGGPDRSGYATEFGDAGTDHPGEYRYQQARWSGNGSVTAKTTISVATQQGAADLDGDGLPDQWEEEGVTINGVSYPLPRWGAKPGQKDLFLQLDWMKSEWETAGCAEKVRPIDQASCGRKDTTTFRPQRSTLKQLEKLFEKHGIALHIDAGPLYAPDFSLAETKGGKKLDYTPFPFDSGNPLQEYQDEFGDRANIFRRGVFGGQMEAGPVEEASTGRARLGGSTFYVAKLPQMNEEDIRNTILHEFGHTLGLDHDGIATDESAKYPNRNYIPGYKSTMNYLYQFDREYGFTYSEEASISGPRTKADVERELESCKREPCFRDAYNIPADWPNLGLRNPSLGKSAGVIGLPDLNAEEHEEDRSVRDLEIIAAESNSGKGGVSNDETGPGGNTVTVGNKKNSIRMVVDNKGLDPHEFTLTTEWPTGKHETKVRTKGILENDYKQPIDVPLGPLTSYSRNTMPVKATLTNSKGELQSELTFDIPVIRVTKEEAKAVLADAAAAPDTKVPAPVKEDLKVNLEPIAKAAPATTVPTSATATTAPAPSSAPSSTTEPTSAAPSTTPRPTAPATPTTAPSTAPTTVPTPAPSTPKPVPTRTTRETKVNTQRPPQDDRTSGSSSRGLFIGLILALGGAVISIIGWLFNQGQVKLPR